MMFRSKVTRAAGMERRYLRTLKRAPATIDPYGAPSLGDLAGGASDAVNKVLNAAAKGLGAAKQPIAELKTAMTITTAASVAAALASVLLLVRTGRR
jgi:hypothetical protein